MIALLFIINYYISAYGCYLYFSYKRHLFLFMCDRSKWKAHIWNVGIGTVTGIGLSACILVPVIFQLSNSQRGSSEGGLFNQYINCISGSILSDRSLAAFQRYMMVYGMAFVIALIVVGLKNIGMKKCPIILWYFNIDCYHSYDCRRNQSAMAFWFLQWLYVRNGF